MKLFKRKPKIIPDKRIIYKPKKSPIIKQRNRSQSLSSKSLLKIFAGALLVIIISFLLYGSIKLIYSPRFKVTELEIIGNKSAPAQELAMEILASDQKSIFLLNTQQISNKLLQKYIFFKKVSIRKIWPNKLWVNILEREPKLIYINLNGAYLIDEDARIIQIISSAKINFSEDNLLIIRGLGNPNSSYVKDRLKTDFLSQTKGSKAKFNFAKIPFSKKLAALEQIKTDLLTKADESLSSHNEKLKDSQYANFPQVYSYDNQNFDLYEEIDKKRLELTVEVENFFRNRKQERITHITWEGNFLIKFSQKNNKLVYFGTNRETSIQLEDYLLVTQQLRFEHKSYSQIDLSSEKISVK